MTGLQIAPDLTLPLDFATEGIVVIGVRGSGKSNTEVRFAELEHDAGIPFVAIDPKGDWYGIRMTGTSPGLPIPVFGGLYGDFPLDEHLGTRIADLLVDNNISAVLDVSRMSHGARARFLTDFFKQLMERHQLEPHVRTVIFEEAHRYIPQNVTAAVAALKEAAAAVLLEGRSFGLGCWACTQRPARLHNDVLEEVDTAIIHRIGVAATADLKRVRDWVKHEDLGDEIGASLTKLKAGEAWVLSPVSLGIVQRCRIDRRTTFDSGATPVVGAEGTVKRRLSTMADIDASAIKEALSDAIEKAKEKDPTELRKQIAALERQLATRPTEPVEVPVPVEVEVPVEVPVLVPVLTGTELGALKAAVEAIEAAEASIGTYTAVVSNALHDATGGLIYTGPGGEWHEPDDRSRQEIVTRAKRLLKREASGEPVAIDGRAMDGMRRLAEPLPKATKSAPRVGGYEAGSKPAAQVQPPPASVAKPRTPVVATGEPDPRVAGDGAPRRILAALARESPLTDRVLAARAGVSRRKSTFRNAISTLRGYGYIDGSPDAFTINAAGLGALGGYEPLPTGRALVDYWMRELGGGVPARILRVLLDAWPDRVDHDTIAEAVEVDRSKSTYRNAMSTLRGLDIVISDRSSAAADDELGRHWGR